MSDVQRKIIALIVLMGACAFVEVAAITAEPLYADVTCAYGQECPDPSMSAETVYGTYALPGFVNSENFETMKWALFGAMITLEAAGALFLVKTLRENQSTNNPVKNS